MGVRIFDDMEYAMADLAGQVDCFFSAHVLEHVPAPSKSFGYAMRLLKPRGFFVSFTPNGSEAHRAASRDWSKVWGQAHPQFIDDVFLDHSFKLSPRAVGSSPGDISPPVECRPNRVDKLAGGVRRAKDSTGLGLTMLKMRRVISKIINRAVGRDI